jgi:outer membrane murein-binding lipoprotein Lpp
MSALSKDEFGSMFRQMFQEELVKSPVIVDMQVDIATLKSNVATLKSDVATLKSDVATLKSDVATLKDDVHALGIGQDHIKSDIRRILDAVLPLVEAREITKKNAVSIVRLEDQVSVTQAVVKQHISDSTIHRR